jgi:carboxyl-terminal processing protease
MSDHAHPKARVANGGAWQRLMIVSVGLLIALVSFAAGMLAERDLLGGGFLSDGVRGDGTAGDMSRLAAVRDLIEKEYYYKPTDPAALDEFRAQLEYNAIAGMTDGLTDDYSTFLAPVEHGPVAEQLAGAYEGIGVTVDYPDGKLTIIAPTPGAPADRVGLRAGDVIEAVDGRTLQGVSEDDALKLVRGPAGTSVRLTIRRPNQAAPFDVDVPREKIVVPGVLYHFLGDKRVAWIQAAVFGDRTTAELDDALRRATTDGAVGIVLDVRNNGGGWVQSAQDTIGRFVSADRGVALYEDIDATDEELAGQPIVNNGEKVFDLPLVVLVNEGTASAAEIVAGALRDYGRAKIVGTKTFGKGSVQRVHQFDDGSSARITFAQWLTPNKQVIEGVGITPDEVVTVPEPVPAGDPQLDRAVELVTAGS